MKILFFSANSAPFGVKLYLTRKRKNHGESFSFFDLRRPALFDDDIHQTIRHDDDFGDLFAAGEFPNLLIRQSHPLQIFF